MTYIYCDYRKQHEQIPVNLIASILQQLLQPRVPTPADVRKSFHHQISFWTRLVAEELYTLLQSVLSSFPQAYIVVDAIDELSVSGQIRQTLQSNLNALRDVHTVNSMMTSRFILQIIQELRDSLCLEIRTSDEDVLRYAQGHIDDLAQHVLKDP